MIAAGKRQPGSAKRSICNLQSVTCRRAKRSGNRVEISGPGQTTMRGAQNTPCVESTSPEETPRTAVRQKKVTPRLCSSHCARRGIASRLSSLSSCGLCSAATRSSLRRGAGISAPCSRRHPSPIGLVRNSCKTLTASVRLAAISKPR